MKDLDPRLHFVCWHESRIANHESILAQGLRPREERIYVALHPHLPLHLGRKFAGHFALYTLVLPLSGPDAWTIGVDCMPGMWESHLRRPIPREAIVDHFDATDPAAWPRCEGRDGPPRRAPLPMDMAVLEGYPGWLPEAGPFLERSRAAVTEHAKNGPTAVLGALYLIHGSACKPPPADVDLIGRSLPRILVEDLRLDPTTLRAAADVLSHLGVAWLATAATLSPPRTIQRASLLAAFAQETPKRDEPNKDPFLRACASALPERHARHLHVIHGLLRGHEVQATDLHDADAPTMEALVQVVRQVPLGTAGGHRALDAVAAMPEPLADLALMELLRHQRSVPSRARRYLVQLLRPRVPRLRAALEHIVATMGGRPHKHALWLLGRAPQGMRRVEERPEFLPLPPTAPEATAAEQGESP